MKKVPAPSFLLAELMPGDTISHTHSGAELCFEVIEKDDERKLPVVKITAAQSLVEPTVLADKINGANLGGVLLGSGDLLTGIPQIESRKVGRIAMSGDNALVIESCHNGELTQDVFPFDPTQPLRFDKYIEL